jgi:threonine aldolase
MQAVGDFAHYNRLKIHVDGARLFNAAIALETEARNLVVQADSVSFCLSKGLAAPVGSVVCSTRDFIAEARRVRKVLGGGMRQAGILAAAGIVALTEMVDRLKDDHWNARRLAKGLSELKGITVDPGFVKTNLVFFEIRRPDMTAEELALQLDSYGIRLLATGPRQLRAVTHYQVTSEDIENALIIFRKVLG